VGAQGVPAAAPGEHHEAPTQHKTLYARVHGQEDPSMSPQNTQDWALLEMATWHALFFKFNLK